MHGVPDPATQRHRDLNRLDERKDGLVEIRRQFNPEGIPSEWEHKRFIGWTEAELNGPIGSVWIDINKKVRRGGDYFTTLQVDVDRRRRSVCLCYEVVFIDGRQEGRPQDIQFAQSAQIVNNACQLAVFTCREKNQQEE